MNIPKVDCLEWQAKRLSPLKAGGKLGKVVCPSSMSALRELSSRLYNERQEYIIAGRMSNILVLEGGYDGVVISTKELKGIDIDNNTICCGSGESLAKIVALAAEKQLGGLEKLTGIPGSVGGAICMNSGCFGTDISAVTKKVFVFDMDKQIPLEWTKQQAKFGYRNSEVKKGNYVVIGACFELEQTSRYDIKNMLQSALNMRKQTQPRLPSLGSVFKRVDNIGAGLFIEGAGLKGCCIGGMEISRVHANFIVNKGGGTADEFLELAQLAEKKVFEKYGIRLEREVRVIGKRAQRPDGGEE